jgi:phytoene synthase
MELFDQTSLECSKLIQQRYSTSITLVIRMLDTKFHFPVYAKLTLLLSSYFKYHLNTI